MKHVIVLLLICTPFILNAQYHKAKLQMVDGSLKDGFAKLPSNKLLDSKVEFKVSKKAKVEKFKDGEVSKIMIRSKGGDQYVFERLPIVHLFKSFGREIEREKSQKHWVLLYQTNKKLSSFSLAQRYKLDRNGVMKSITGSNSIWEFVYFLLKRTEEDKAYIVSGMGFTNGQVRKAMAIYFNDIPEFVERINNKEFKKHGVHEVANEYAKYFN